MSMPARALGWIAVSAGALGVVLTIVGVVVVAFVVLAGYEPPTPIHQLEPATDGKPSVGTIPIRSSGPYTIDVWGSEVRGCVLDVTGPRGTKLHDASNGGLCRVDVTAEGGDRYDVTATVHGPGPAYVSLRPVYDTPSPFRWAKWAGALSVAAIALGGVLLALGYRRAR
ncbi:MAG: hypothetical protein JNL38_15205 [Myxococcales bacterium]|nr:hypothetical protein [Myxococcales bacterium]